LHPSRKMPAVPPLRLLEVDVLRVALRIVHLVMVKNNLNSEQIIPHLTTKFIGQNIFYYDCVTSTNEIAKQIALNKCVEGSVVISQEQTEGKGRLNRIWKTPKGTLALSIILYPKIDHLPLLIMIASLAVVRSIKILTGLTAEIKWPNDVLIKGKKVCGILIENKLKGDKVEYSIIGIGLNVNLKSSTISDFAYPTTSLSDEINDEISLLQVIRHLLSEFELLYQSKDTVFGEWHRNLVTLGKSIRVTSGNSVYEGVAESVDISGNLILKQIDGSTIKIVAGDVTLRSS
jgi:BirA family transcriptional regulator, biotin operon repressor / biotin---[acetyl-CoA-carboxylase] ligase